MREITAQNEKMAICNAILRALPSWFGIEESIVEYVNDSKEMPFYAAFDGDKPVGFVAVKVHNQYTAEVCVMGVLEEYHRRGVGKALINWCEDYCRATGRGFLTVKTLDEAHPDEGYKRTRQFYLGMGFRPLEVFPTLWDEANPCLFMAKTVG
jgi:Acetyltransferases